MNFDIATATPIVAFVLSLIALGTQVRSILSSGEKKLDERLTKAESKLVEYDRRVQTLESEMRHMPDRDTAHRLELTMEKISGRLDTLDERLKPIAATSGRLQEFLLEQAQK
ncbi:DUF2730 domain-containing protein [Shinella pollutisoli]|uniref:DUF2730 domain-containing protein n=1 Tax=Shinella pollutisoli TaxID=2250594 RepID=A0ABV7DK89_9HYPH|nr:DUF2730 domain-containing protein [Shinella pollutisoli]